MTAPVDRAQALRELIERVEAGAVGGDLFVKDLRACGFMEMIDRAAVNEALHGSLDAVARLEAPLRERDWTGPLIHPPEDEDPCWEASWLSEHNQTVEARSYHEPRARLLAVLRCLLAEEEAAS